MYTNYSNTVIFSIYGQFEAMPGWILDTLSIISLTTTFNITKTFLKKLNAAKLRGPDALRYFFLKLHRCVYLHTKFQISRIILISFREGE